MAEKRKQPEYSFPEDYREELDSYEADAEQDRYESFITRPLHKHPQLLPGMEGYEEEQRVCAYDTACGTQPLVRGEVAHLMNAWPILPTPIAGLVNDTLGFDAIFVQRFDGIEVTRLVPAEILAPR